MPTIKSLDDAAETTGVPRRTLQRWLNEGKLTPWSIEGDRRRFVDIEEIEKLREPKPVDAATIARRPKKPSVAACYIVRDGLLLMVRRRFKQGTLEWAGPSGNIKAGETAEEAAVRETMEEVGVEVEPIRTLGNRIHPATGRHLIYLACRYVSGEARVVDHEEVSAVEWVPIPEALERWAGLTGGVFPPVREYLERELRIARTLPEPPEGG